MIGPWKSPRAATSVAALALLALVGCTEHDGPAGAGSCILVTLDTTRVDALGSYAEARTPFLDRLAGEGVVFDNAYSPIPLTLPAHASLLSGLYPLRHGVRDNGLMPLPAAASTLAEAARDAGARTAAFVGAVVLDAAFGLDQGFDVYDGPPPGKEHAERSATSVVDAALRWWEGRERDRPFFLWVHLYDPHSPYAPPADLDGASAREDYAGELTYVDRELERLFDAVDTDGALDEVLVCVVSDHGEGFGEHGEEGHSIFCYETTLRVPLILRAPRSNPGRLTPGTRSDELVGLVDLRPTIAEALGWETPPTELDGKSFWSAPPDEDHGLYFESYYGYFSFGWSPLTGWIDRRGKYLHGTTPRFFAVDEDPGETTNLFSETDERVRAHRTRIALLAKRAPLEPDEGGGADADLLESIRGLGYASLGGSETAYPHPLEDTGLPNPEEVAPLHERSLEGIQLGKQGRLKEAEAVFREILAANPQNYFVLDHLATCLFQEERFTEAADTLRTLLEKSPTQPPESWFKLGLAEQAAGRTEEAIEAFERSAVLAPRPDTLRTLVGLLRERDRDRARFWAERLKELEGG